VLEEEDGSVIGKVRANSFNRATRSVILSGVSYRIGQPGRASSGSLDEEIAHRHVGRWQGSGFRFNDGEFLRFTIQERWQLKAAIASMIDFRSNPVVTMRWLGFPLMSHDAPLAGMRLGEAVLLGPIRDDLIAVTALAFEKFEIAFQREH
jgi:hypothetical protein